MPNSASIARHNSARLRLNMRIAERAQVEQRAAPAPGKPELPPSEDQHADQAECDEAEGNRRS